MRLRSSRLELVATTRLHIEADLDSPASLGRCLGAQVPASWPPGEYDRDAMEFFRDKLADDDAVGWYGWYALHPVGPGLPLLVGAAGFLGPPDADGVVEVGYSVAPEFEGRGFAAEMVAALVTHGFTTPRVTRVIAHADRTNRGSIRVLEKCGFSLAVADDGKDAPVRYQRLRHPR